VPAFAPDDKDIDIISTGLYENKMKKSELKSIIREEMGLSQRPVKVAQEENKQVKNEVIASVVAGEFVKPEIVTAIMAAVPTLVALGAAINWKEEIAAWLKGLASKDEEIEDVVMKDK
jgi:anthranilate phosphoribosyltransferase